MFESFVLTTKNYIEFSSVKNVLKSNCNICVTVKIFNNIVMST